MSWTEGFMKFWGDFIFSVEIKDTVHMAEIWLRIAYSESSKRQISQKKVDEKHKSLGELTIASQWDDDIILGKY